LNEKTPNVLQRAQRQPDAKIWNDIIEIVRGEPGLEFWKNMALQELGAKGKRGKELRIVLPSGHEDLVSCGESHHDSESEEEEDEKPDELQDASSNHVESVTDAGPASYNEPAAIRSFADARAAQRIPLRQSLGSFQDVKPAASASEIPFADRETSSVTTTQQFQPRAPLMPPASSLPTPSALVTPPPTTMTPNPVPKVENETRFVKFFQFSMYIN
jgi:hypothetical protein